VADRQRAERDEGRLISNSAKMSPSGSFVCPNQGSKGELLPASSKRVVRHRPDEASGGIGLYQRMLGGQFFRQPDVILVQKGDHCPVHCFSARLREAPRPAFFSAQK